MASSLSQFYAGRTLFLTGGVGFVGKQIIEKLLRSCPAIEQINVFVRPKKDKSPTDRVNELLQSPIFDRLKAEQPGFRQKVRAVPGDLLLPGLGLSDADYSHITSNASLYVHAAANLNFLDPMSKAFESNTIPTQRVLQLAREAKLAEAFIYVSTAYCQVDKNPIEEKIYEPPITFNQLKVLLEALSDEQMLLLQPSLLGFLPNCYALSKAVSEKVVSDEHGSIPTAIVRPPTICGAVQEPFPGWVDSTHSLAGIICGAAYGMVRNKYGDPTAHLDNVPVDFIAHSIIAAVKHMAETKNNSAVKVFNVTMGNEQSLTMKAMFELIEHNVIKYPLKSRIGKPVTQIVSKKALARFDMNVRLPIRAHIADTYLRLTGKKPRAMKQLLQFNKFQRVMEFFTLNEFNWITTNTANLYNSLSPQDKKDFNFQMKMDWEPYFTQFWFGIRKYALKDPVNTEKHIGPAEKPSQNLSRVA